MTAVISLEALEAKLNVATDPTQRRLYFAALLASAADLTADEFFVVGGSAIEFYTAGEYTSGDVDVVSSRNERLREILRNWGFRRDGRIWFHEDLDLVVDIHRYPYTGDVGKTTVVSTPYGLVRLAAIEDLLVKRLISTKFWRIKDDFEQAKLLAIEFADRIDWEYVERFARQEDVVDLLTILREIADARNKGRRTST